MTPQELLDMARAAQKQFNQTAQQTLAPAPAPVRAPVPTPLPATRMTDTRTTIDTRPAAPVQQAAAPLPAPPPQPATPAAPPQPSPEQRVKSDLDAGMAWAKEHIKDGSLGRLSDPRQAEVNDLLAMQKARLGGMTEAEQRATQEQGQAGINRQLSSNLRQLGGIAAANGVRGGAASGLQMGALNAAQQAQGDLQRKLVLDNMAQKNTSFDQYGRTLGNQQNTELGIGKYNIDQGNREQLGQLGSAFQYGGLIDSVRAGDKADALADRNITLSEKALESMQKMTENSGSMSEDDKKSLASAKRAESDILSRIPDIQTAMAFPSGARDAAISELRSAIAERVRTEHPDVGETELNQLINNEVNHVLEVNGKQLPGLNEAVKNNALGKPANGTVVCTEAARQGYFDLSTGLSMAAREKMTFRAYRNYLLWGVPTVALMQKVPLLARGIAWFLPDTLLVIAGKPARFRGCVGAAVFRMLGYVAGAVRDHRRKHLEVV